MEKLGCVRPWIVWPLVEAKTIWGDRRQMKSKIIPDGIGGVVNEFPGAELV
jgi:hypothetical protein